MKTTHVFITALLYGALPFLCGCGTFTARSHHRTTSVIQFLYPNEAEHVEAPAVPTLALPLKVGVAFVPLEHSKTRAGNHFPISDATVNEAQKLELMKAVSQHFKQHAFVKSIQLIPSAYLTPGGSFDNLDQLRSMFGIDVVALLSYDQVQFTDEGLLSITYWTIVGAFAVEGERNDTRTMLDAVVYDIPSREMLFRAPGTSHIKGSATPINLSEQLRRDSEKGFAEAATNLVSALEFELTEFKDRVRKSPEEIKVIHKPGYVGAASIGGLEALLLGSLALAGMLWRRPKS